MKILGSTLHKVQGAYDLKSVIHLDCSDEFEDLIKVVRQDALKKLSGIMATICDNPDASNMTYSQQEAAGIKSDEDYRNKIGYAVSNTDVYIVKEKYTMIKPKVSQAIESAIIEAKEENSIFIIEKLIQKERELIEAKETAEIQRRDVEEKMEQIKEIIKEER